MNRVYPVCFLIEEKSIWLGWSTNEQEIDFFLTDQRGVLWKRSRDELIEAIFSLPGEYSFGADHVFNLNLLKSAFSEKKQINANDVLTIWNLFTDFKFTVYGGGMFCSEKIEAYDDLFESTDAGEIIFGEKRSLKKNIYQELRQVIHDGGEMLLLNTIKMASNS